MGTSRCVGETGWSPFRGDLLDRFNQLIVRSRLRQHGGLGKGRRSAARPAAFAFRALLDEGHAEAAPRRYRHSRPAALDSSQVERFSGNRPAYRLPSLWPPTAWDLMRSPSSPPPRNVRDVGNSLMTAPVRIHRSRSATIQSCVPGGPNCHSPGEIAGRGVLAHACRALNFFLASFPKVLESSPP